MAVVVLVGNVVLLLLSTCHLATAGDYRHGKRRQPVPLEESFYNHQPGQLLAKSAMPKEFNWVCPNFGALSCRQPALLLLAMSLM